MKPRAETPYLLMVDHSADEFQQGVSYKTWRPCGTRDWLLIFTKAGSGCITTASGRLLTRPGDAILYAPGEMQDYKTNPAAGRWHLLWVHFVPKPSWLPWLRWPTGAHGGAMLHLEKGEIRDSFTAAMYRLIRMSRRRLPNARDFSGNALEEALLWAHAVASQDDWTRTDPRIRKAMDYLVADLRRPFQLADLARHCGLSVSRLAHLFKDEVGASPQQFFERQRMWQSGRLLRLTSLRIGEVAAEVGYDDAFYFSNRFRRYAGINPTRFRQQADKVLPSPAAARH